MENSRVPKECLGVAGDSTFITIKSTSFGHRATRGESLPSWSKELGFGRNDRRFTFARQSSFGQSSESYSPVSIVSNGSDQPLLSPSVSSFNIPSAVYPKLENNWEEYHNVFHREENVSSEKFFFLLFLGSAIRLVRYGNRPMKRLLMMIFLNVAYSTVELFIGLFSGRAGLISDAFHLTFGCGVLTFSLFAMAISMTKPDGVYTYGYERLEVLSAFTNALFLLFMSFSLAVEALHAFIHDESEHKHYLIISAVTNLLVNLLGIWFFRNYACINLVYRKAEDMNFHSVCLHVLADSIRSAGLILASWLLTLGVKNAEVLCLGLVSAAVFMLIMPLFRTSGGILLQMAPPKIPSSALSKCWRQICTLEDVLEVSQARFWELVPGHVVGSLSIQVKKGLDDHPILSYVRGLYHDLGVQDLTVETNSV